MNAPTVRIERRVGQRFSYLLPISFRDAATGIEGRGFTQDLSSRGVFFLTDAAIAEGSPIELTVRMPSEITLGESMPVRCRGHVLRVMGPAANQVSPNATPAATKIGVAVRLESYEYLAESAGASLSIPRVAALHSHSLSDKPLA